jgi:hypothetical protein
MIPFHSTLMAVLSGLLLILASSASVQAVENDALWLPGSYTKLAHKLRRAALKLEATPRCDKVLRGSLHESTQGMEQAVFLLVCRDPERKTFSVLADANSLELTYMVPLDETKVYVGKELRKRVAAVWEDCEAKFESKTRFMRKLKRLQEGRPDPQAKATGEVGFDIDFDAQTLQGKPLLYRAHCFSPDEETAATLKIRARKPGQ